MNHHEFPKALKVITLILFILKTFIWIMQVTAWTPIHVGWIFEIFGVFEIFGEILLFLFLLCILIYAILGFISLPFGLYYAFKRNIQVFKFLWILNILMLLNIIRWFINTRNIFM